MHACTSILYRRHCTACRQNVSLTAPGFLPTHSRKFLFLMVIPDASCASKIAATATTPNVDQEERMLMLLALVVVLLGAACCCVVHACERRWKRFSIGFGCGRRRSQQQDVCSTSIGVVMNALTIIQQFVPWHGLQRRSLTNTPKEEKQRKRLCSLLCWQSKKNGEEAEKGKMLQYNCANTKS